MSTSDSDHNNDKAHNSRNKKLTRLPRIIKLSKKDEYEIFNDHITFYSSCSAEKNNIGTRNTKHYYFLDARKDHNGIWRSYHKYLDIEESIYKMKIKHITYENNQIKIITESNNIIIISLLIEIKSHPFSYIIKS